MALFPQASLLQPQPLNPPDPVFLLSTNPVKHTFPPIPQYLASVTAKSVLLTTTPIFTTVSPGRLMNSKEDFLGIKAKGLP